MPYNMDRLAPVCFVAQLKVFISHTTQDPRDYARAHEIAAELRELGAEVWIAPESIPPGTEWEEQIVCGVLDQCKYFLVLLTPASSRSEWVLREVQLATTRYGRSDGEFAILPIIVGEVGKSPAVAFVRRFQAIPWRDNCAEQVYLVAQALGIEATSAPLTSTARALQFLEREKRREEESMQVFRRIRALSPLVGLAAYAPIALLLPEAKGLAAVVLAGGPLVTGAIGWSVTLRRIQQSASMCRRLDTMRDGLDLCFASTTPPCRRLWTEFWTYAERSAGLTARVAKP
jgi:TIR domain